MTPKTRYIDREPVGEWANLAACRGMNTDVFFSAVGRVPKEAKAVCARCPVRSECLEHALANQEDQGVWGGLSHRERQAIGYAYRPPLKASSSPCGTESGYTRHRRAGEPTCQPCKDAHAKANTLREKRAS